jgi:FKBP-type peptidyl-prolyl cis-trans isomerase 2
MGEEERANIGAEEENAKRHEGRAKKVKPAAKRKPTAKKAAPAAERHYVTDDAKTGGTEIPKELVIGVVIILAVLAGLWLIMGQDTGSTTLKNTTVDQTPKNANVAEKNDIVTVEYTGMLMNGTVFDTSNLELAQKSGSYNPVRTYEPITFTLGYGGLIPGFEEAVEGMTIGQGKDVTLPPEKAYGYPKSKLVQTIERLQKSPVVQNVSVEKFKADIGTEPYVGLEFKVENKSAYELGWPMKVLSMNNDTVTFRYYPTGNATINTVFGPADVYGLEDSIVIKINPTAGQKIVTLAGTARIMDVNDKNVTVDFNNELAGQTLKFNIKLLGVVKQQ